MMSWYFQALEAPTTVWMGASKLQEEAHKEEKWGSYRDILVRELELVQFGGWVENCTCRWLSQADAGRVWAVGGG